LTFIYDISKGSSLAPRCGSSSIGGVGVARSAGAVAWLRSGSAVDGGEMTFPLSLRELRGAVCP
jgi:hypothetical protein